MQLLNPYALLLVPLIVVVLLLARRRIVRTRRPVSAPFLWDNAVPLQRFQALRLRVRRHRLLAVQAGLMLTVVMILARPLVSLSVPEVDFLVDVSASMGAREDGVSRFDLATRAAMDVVRTLPRGTRIHLWTSNRVEDPIDTDAPGLAAALARVRLSDGDARLRDAIDTIRTTRQKDRPLFVFSDTAPAPQPAGIYWRSVGQPVNNVALVALIGRQRHEPEPATELLVGIRNFGRRDVDVPFEVRSGDVVIATNRVRLAAGAGTTVTLHVPPVTGPIAATLALTDGLAADNRRYAVLPSPAPRRALLVSTGNDFLERALATNPSLTVERVTPGGAFDAARYDLVVCDRCTVPPSGMPALVVVSGRAESAPAALRIVASAHPLGRFLEAAGAEVMPVDAPALPPNAVVVGSAGGAPVIIASETNGRRAVELRTRLDESSFALTPGFPIFIANAVSWLMREDENSQAVVAGGTLQWRVPTEDPVAVRGPDGTVAASTVNNRILSVAGLDRAGVYDVQSGGRHQPFVVNTATESESDLSAAVASQAGGAADDIRLSYRTFDMRIPLLIVALLLLGVETALSAPLSRGAAAFRVSIAAALVAGAAVPPVRWGSAAMDVMFVLDRSSSIPDDAARLAIQQINDASATMERRDRAGLIVFGDTAAIEQPLASSLRVSRINSRVAAGATNIEAALRLARVSLGPRGGRVVLISDGVQTTGDLARELGAAAVARVPVDVIAPDGRDRGAPPLVEGITAPAVVRDGEPFVIGLRVRGRSGTRADVSVVRDGQSLTTIPVDVQADGVGVAEWSEAGQPPGLHTYTASVRVAGAPDGFPDAGTVVTVHGEPRVLYVSNGRPSLIPLLEAGGWRVQTADVGSLPAAAAALREFDAVILEGVDNDDLATAQASAVAEYVEKHAGGLVVLGTPSLRSYVTGELARLLPVDVRPREGARGPGMALVLAFDTSGSMADPVGGVSKIELARQSVIRALEAIPPSDLFGAIAFDVTPTVVAPLAAGSDASAIARRLRSLEARGATSIAPAIDLAESWLRSASVARRRVLLVSDGRTAPADIERLRAAVRARRFELSVVAIGNDADRALLTSLAAESGGRAYFPADVADLPKIVARDAAAASAGGQVEERFAARLLPHAVTRGLDQAMPPTLGGYVVTSAKRGAEEMLTSHLEDPLLAGWRVGLGRVAVFTSDLRSAWAGSLRQWDRVGPLWQQLVRWTGRGASASDVILTLEPLPSGLHVVLSVDGPAPAERLVDATASIRTPGGEVLALMLTPSAPDQYEGIIPASDEGTYLVNVAATRADGDAERITQGVYWTSANEHPDGPNRPVLASIAASTGGRVLDSAGTVFGNARPGEPRDIRWAFTTAALLAFMIDVLRRRGIFARRPALPHPTPGGSARAAA